VSLFGDLFSDGPVSRLLAIHGDTISYKTVAGVVTTPEAIYNELVGAMDDFGNAVFTVSTDASIGIAAPERGDEITFQGDKWVIVDVRDDFAGSAELRTIRGMEVS